MSHTSLIGRLQRRAVAAGVAAVTFGSALVLGAPSAQALGLRLNPNANGTAVRSQADASSTLITRLNGGAPIEVACQVMGGTVSMSGWGTSAVWDFVPALGGYVADLFVDGTPYAVRDSRLPTCGAAASSGPTGAVQTGGYTLTLRYAPSSSSSAVGSIPDRTRVGLSCWTRGNATTGVFGTTDLWHKIAYGSAVGYASDAWLYTGTNGPVAGEQQCAGVPSVPSGSASSGRVYGDDYPSWLKTARLDALVDPWRYYNRECTSFVAWRLNSKNGVAWTNWQGGVNYGNANTWDDAARRLGVRVDSSPAVGAVAQTDAGYFGHVAWVAQVNSDGTVTVEEYNAAGTGYYSSRRVAASAFRYVHVRDL